jgi:hypothetical protein
LYISHTRVKISDLRAYADGLKVTTDQVSCDIPAQVTGTAKLTGCTKTVSFEQFGGYGRKCDGSSRSDRNSIYPVTTAEFCAEMCVEDGDVNKLTGFNFNCMALTCEW